MKVYNYDNNYIIANNESMSICIYDNLIAYHQEELCNKYNTNRKHNDNIKTQETYMKLKLKELKKQEKEKQKIQKEIEKRNNHNNEIIEGYVYIFKCNGYYKIGKSINPDNRLNTLKTGSPYEIDIVQILKSKNMNILEKLLHTLFKEKRINREWFKLDDKDICLILDKKFDNFINNYIDNTYEYKRNLSLPNIYSDVI